MSSYWQRRLKNQKYANATIHRGTKSVGDALSSQACALISHLSI